MNQFDEDVTVGSDKDNFTSILCYIDAEASHHWAKIGVGYELAGMREYIAEGCHRQGDMDAGIIWLRSTRECLCAEINQTHVTLLYIFAILGAVFDVQTAILVLREVHGDYAVSRKC